MADFRRVTFTTGSTTYHLGYYEYITFSYKGNTQVKVIPRARGVKIWDTDTLGGGEVNINVKVFITSSSRLDIETKMNDLINNLGGKTGDLTIEGSLTLTDCTFDNLTMDDTNLKDLFYSINFIKSI